MDNVLYGQSAINRTPDDPRESMGPEADMSPDDAREFVFELTRGMAHRVHEMPDDAFTFPENQHHLPPAEKQKQHFGEEPVQLLSGIEAALREWDESGKNIQDLKDKYSGTFVEGVEIGERLAVYEGRDFSFSEPEDDSPDFTFST